MKFSQQLIEKTEQDFKRLKQETGEELFQTVENFLKAQDEELFFLLKWIYANSPIADWGRYDVSLFLQFAKHGLFLLKHSPFAKELTEKVFLSYVLHPRVNDEMLSDCRPLFYSLLEGRIRGLSAKEAALAVNEFCAENVSYAGSDSRTRSALSAFNFSTGRCGEESVFAVNALRAAGIPARQVYAPLWSHCDDNHAWVEVYLEDGWHFFGACEIEEILDCGWFNGASSRAMFAYARCFGDPPDGDILFQEPPLSYINVLSRYARVKKLKILVRDEQGVAQNARVRLQILNYGNIYPVAELITDERGAVEFECGYGSVFVRAESKDLFNEVLIDTRTCDETEIILLKPKPCGNAPQKFVFFAPEGGDFGKNPTALQREHAREKRKRAEALRAEKRAPDLFQEFKNSTSFDEQAQKLFCALTPKDRQDADCKTLSRALSFGKEFFGKFPDEILYPYLLNPRVENEPLFPDREQIFGFFSEAERNMIQTHPEAAYQFAFSGETLRTPLTRRYYSPLAILKGGAADVLSREILFVQILRALGIPARLDPIQKKPQYYSGTRFVDAVAEQQGTLVLERKEAECSLTRIFPDKEREISLNEFPLTEKQIVLSLPVGNYRLITQNRLPNGNSLAVKEEFSLSAGECKTLKFKIYEANLADFTLDLPLSTLWREGDGVFVLADPGAEPTEHFFAEIKELSARKKFKPVTLLREGQKASEKVIALSERIAFFRPDWAAALARKLFVEPECFPLVLIVLNNRAKFVSAGYRVGSAELVCDLRKMLFDENS